MTDRSDRPNVVLAFADQMRAQAVGYAGDPNVRTPHLDRLAAEGVNFVQAVAGCPVCSPFRASLLTGRYPLTHGVFLNDVCLSSDAVSLAEAYRSAGYRTAYIGKWHLDGHGRSNPIPPERRQGFEFWRVLECTHRYNQSHYYAGDSDEKRRWDGYDAIAQTREAQRYLTEEVGGDPFLLVVSWGPPHNPYQTAPAEFKALYDPATIVLRPNVPPDCADQAREDLAGYYAHVSALDWCVGQLRQTLAETGLEDNTIFVFTSDHGDMLRSQGQQRKQKPWEESIRIPFLLSCPAKFGSDGRTVTKFIDAPDIMPTLLALSGVAIPDTVEGDDLTPYILGRTPPEEDAALITCVSPFGEWTRRNGGREYRGVRTARYTYVRDLDGPWLVYDNQADPYQLENLCGRPEAAEVQARLDTSLKRKLQAAGDEFLPGRAYVERWGYVTDEDGTVPYEL